MTIEAFLVLARAVRRGAMRYAIGLAAVLYVMSGTQALASVGVTVNSTTCSNKAYADLNVGDTITVDFTTSASGNYYSYIADAIAHTVSNGDSRNYTAGTPSTISYVLNLKPTSGNLLLSVDGALNNFALTCPAVVAAPAPAASTTTPVDSQKLQTLQTSITTSVATTSGSVIGGAIDSGIGLGFADGGTPSSFGETGGFINFAATPRSDIEERTDDAFSALAYAGPAKTSPLHTKAPPRLEQVWSAWADIRGTGWKANDTSGSGNDLKGNQVNLTAGIGRKLDTDTLVGVVLGYEQFKYDVATLGGSLKGDGETVGGYVSRRLGGHLRFDAALAWSDVKYNASAGAASGSFDGSRWLVTTGLTGNTRLGAFMLEPSAKLFMLWERQTAWTDSLGTLQAGRNFSAGRTALGSKAAYPIAMKNGWTLSPYAGFYGDWRFQSDSALPTGTQVGNIGAGWSGRVTSGVVADLTNGASLSLGGEYGGLGANYKIWSGNVRASIPF